MKKNIKTLILAILFISINCIAQEKYTGQNIYQILNLPEKQINLTIASIEICRMVDPSINVDEYIGKIKKILYKIYDLRELMGVGETQRDIIMSTLRYLHLPEEENKFETFEYIEGYKNSLKYTTPMITHYLDTKRGNCVSMPLLFTILCQEQGVDMRMVKVANHFFCRFYDTYRKKYINMEMTNKGAVLRDEFIIEQFQISKKSVETGIYMKSYTKRELLLNYLINTAYVPFTNRGELDKAKKVINFCLETAPNTFTTNRLVYDYNAMLINNFIEKNNYKNKKWSSVPKESREYIKELKSKCEKYMAKIKKFGFKENPIDWNKKYELIRKGLK